MKLSKEDFTEEEWDLLKLIAETDGMELHQDDWALGYALEGKGAVTLGRARGPDRKFRRIELATEPVVEGL